MGPILRTALRVPLTAGSVDIVSPSIGESPEDSGNLWEVGDFVTPVSVRARDCRRDEGGSHEKARRTTSYQSCLHPDGVLQQGPSSRTKEVELVCYRRTAAGVSTLSE